MRILSGAPAAMCLVLAACGPSVDVKTDYDPASVRTMSAYRSYAWAPVRTEQGIPDIAKQRIQSAVDASLRAKGLERKQSGADFLVATVVSTSAQMDYTTTSNYYGYGYGRWYGPGMVTSHTTARPWTQGTLVIDIVDGTKNELVYRATGQAEVDKDLSPQERQIRLNEVVAKMLAGFPPKP